MELTVSPTGYTSNSYVTLAEANTFLTGFSDGWFSQTEDARTDALYQATIILESFPLRGTKYYDSVQEKSLHFARTIDYRSVTTDGVTTIEYYVPEDVKRAQILLADHILKKAASSIDETNIQLMQSLGIRDYSLGDFSITLSEITGTIAGQESLLPPLVRTFFSKYIQRGGKIYPGNSPYHTGIRY